MGFDQRDENAHATAHVQHSIAAPDTSRVDNPAEAVHHVRRLGNIEYIDQAIETAALVAGDVGCLFEEHRAAPLHGS